ncbi:MAG: MFS transporter [Candidatus Omnitrophica bacterium]|nr:MFS transporter [Candidatus Omnitrophota bacterium]
MDSLRFIGRALRYRNYRLFFAGQSVSLIGTWLQQTALPWLVYRLTSSVFLLGVVGFLSQIPTFLLTPLAGVLIDRLDRRRILMITQIAAMLQALLLWLLLVSHHMSIPAVLILSFLLGVVNAFDIPARQAFVIDMVEHKEDLGNAIALNSSMVHAARLIGPTIAGVLIGFAGEASCFLLNGLSFLAVIVSLMKMRIRQRPRAFKQDSLWQGLKEGIRYVSSHIPMKAVLALLTIVSLTGMPYMVFMPVFARDIFYGTSYTLGFLIGASGLGALGGAVYLASRGGIKGFGRMIAGASALFGLGLMAFALSKTLWLSWGCMVLVGFGMMVQFAATNTVLQTIVEDSKRGRVMSLYTVAFMGTTPLGSLIEGWMAHRLGVPITIFAGGLICLIASLGFARYLPYLREVMSASATMSQGEISPSQRLGGLQQL